MSNTIGSMLCPRCGKLISKNAQECIHCGLKNPGGPAGAPEGLQNLLHGNFSYISGLFTTCVALFVISLLLNPAALFQMQGGSVFGMLFSFLSPDQYVLFSLGMTGRVPVFSAGHWWSVITAIFLHGSLLHIVFNMYWLRQVGPLMEELYGPARFFIIFMVSGILGFLVSSLFNDFTLGASGSILGLIGAAVYYGRDRGGVYGMEMYRQFGQIAIFLLIFGLVFAGVDNFAHAGGFAGGYLSAMVLKYRERATETPLHNKVAMALLSLTVLAFGFAAFSLLSTLF